MVANYTSNNHGNSSSNDNSNTNIQYIYDTSNNTSNDTSNRITCIKNTIIIIITNIKHNNSTTAVGRASSESGLGGRRKR